jgi:hypothetical protein
MMVAVVPLGFDSFEAVRPYSSHSTVTVAYGRFWFDGFPSPATFELVKLLSHQNRRDLGVGEASPDQFKY